MKHLFFALVIALLSASAATTAWSQQTTPTEQETKEFITKTMNRCEKVKGAQFRGETLHLRFTRQLNIPVHELEKVISYSNGLTLDFYCKGIEGTCMSVTTNKDTEREGYYYINICPKATNEVVAKAFNHLIGIYDAKRPKPLFE